MRNQRQHEQGTAAPATSEAQCPSANAQASAVGPDVSPPAPWPLAESDRSAPPRLHVPNRQQLLSAKIIDELLEADHPARAVWAYVEALDLTLLYEDIRARGRHAGRPATDPRVLVALLLYATFAGFTSDREIADLCQHHDAFRWLAGGVAVNHHTLSDFRTDKPEFLEQLLKQSVEVLRQKGLTDLDRIAQDGMRVRASAGAASFRRRATLERLLKEAQDDIKRLREQLAAYAADPTATQGVTTEQTPAEVAQGAREQATAMQHAEDRLDRLERAMERLPEMEAKIAPADNKEARVSTTDPEATVMKMADGGYRPAYNIEYATACQGMAIGGVDVVTTGNDQGQLPPMLEQIENRFDTRPKEALIDGGFVKFADIEEVQGAPKKTTVYAPVPKPKKEGIDRYAPKASDSAEVAEWRQRMGTEEAKNTYKARGATAECVNAQARNRGLQQFAVRGLQKVKAVATWFAIAHNMARSFSLDHQPPGLAHS